MGTAGERGGNNLIALNILGHQSAREGSSETRYEFEITDASDRASTGRCKAKGFCSGGAPVLLDRKVYDAESGKKKKGKKRNRYKRNGLKTFSDKR